MELAATHEPLIEYLINGNSDRPYVEFDLTPLPCEENREWSLEIKVSTKRAVITDKCAIKGVTERFANCEAFVLGLQENGYEAEVINKSKIRVYGAKTDGTFYPAIKGSVETKGLRKDEVPKVTVVGKKG